MSSPEKSTYEEVELGESAEVDGESTTLQAIAVMVRAIAISSLPLAKTACAFRVNAKLRVGQLGWKSLIRGKESRRK